MITLDTSGLLALLNRRDPDHQRTRAVLLQDPGPYVVPARILAEVTYMVEQRLGILVLDLFLADLESSADALECGDADFPRIRALASWPARSDVAAVS